MPSCPDCNGEMKWRNPFYVCNVCGLALRKYDLERYKKQKDDEVWEARYGEHPDDRKQRDYLKWYLKK